MRDGSAIAVEVCQGSVTEADVDVIVSTSNTLLEVGTRVATVIRSACGPGFESYLQSVLQNLGRELEPGEVVLTHAGAHPRARFVAHVALTDHRLSSALAPDLQRIETATAALWERIDEQCTEPHLAVGMIPLAAGPNPADLAEATRVACETLSKHRSRHPEGRIRKVVFYGWTFEEWIAVLRTVRRYFPHVAVVPEVRTVLAILDGN